ncbi:MAG: mannosyltransferase family protein, partial [Candidatus Promineifilaceae bacterium]
MSSEAGDRPLGPDAQEAEATGLDGFQGGRAWGQAGQGSQAAVPWWAWLTAGRWLWLPAAAFLGTRLLIGVVIIVAGQIVVDWPIPPPYHIVPHNIILDSLGSRWDTGFYLSIANEGYRYQGVETPSVAFFPLLPLLMRAVGRLTGGDALLAGVIIANVALLGASVLLYRLAELEWGPAVAGRATLYFLIFPASFFGSAIYTESLFLFFAIGSLYLARRGVWEGAALLGGGASLTRLMGLLVAPLLLVEWWQQRRTRPAGERPAAAALLAAFIAPLGTLLY